MLACQIRDGVMQLMLLAQAQAPQLTPRSARSRSRCSPWTLCLFLHLLQSLCIFGMLIASNVSKYKESLSHSVEDFRIHIDHVSYTDMRVLPKFIRIFQTESKMGSNPSFSVTKQMRTQVCLCWIRRRDARAANVLLGCSVVLLPPFISMNLNKKLRRRYVICNRPVGRSRLCDQRLHSIIYGLLRNNFGQPRLSVFHLKLKPPVRKQRMSAFLYRDESPQLRNHQMHIYWLSLTKLSHQCR